MDIHAPAFWVGWEGSDRCSGVVNGLWIEFSLGFGAQKREHSLGFGAHKRARYRVWLDGFAPMFGGRWWALDWALARVWRARARPLEGLAGRVRIDVLGSPVSSGLSARSDLEHKSAPAIGVGWHSSWSPAAGCTENQTCGQLDARPEGCVACRTFCAFLDFGPGGTWVRRRPRIGAPFD